MSKKVDLNRGVLQTRYKAEGDSVGFLVSMYLDPEGVGHYLDPHGNEISEDIARAAGIDTDKYNKERRKFEALRTFKSKLEIELEGSNEAAPEVVLAEANGWKVVVAGNDVANVRDPDGNVLNAHPLPSSMAKTLLEKLTGTQE